MTVLNPSAMQKFDYKWQPIHQVNKVKIPSILWPWLATQASLTKKLKNIGQLSVDVIEDSWGSPTQREKRRLKLRPREAARIRAVLLKVDGVSVIYARSIIPARSFRGHWRQVKHLKNKPLGGFLFQHRRLKRSKIEVTRLPKSLFPNQTNSLWARRSVFQQFGPGILVNEAFFENIYELKQPFGLT
ncbi:chorismate--pyruvate lyase family protein [Marinomonas transparens]|uniref:Probable chorismate pyruvate-lyase n=1 Tax=Marinomonas transparens TaxID=2795388 RepID=A0A934JQK6_9GAMM|nr:chorismate lyase [Marinomonas transparens]MBJ7536436.1 chorismate lyase [Marinomonas transparens]